MLNKDLDRFWKCIYLPDNATDDDCWEWIAGKYENGYGQFKLTGNSVSKRAHRLSYEHYKGTIEDGLYALHKCDCRACVNPNHIFIGTHLDNVNDSTKKGRHTTFFISDLEVLEIRDLASKGFTMTEIAKKFNASIDHIGRIVSNKRRKNVIPITQ